MENTQTLLEGSNDMEKGAYLGAIASLATADRQATPEEVEYLNALCEAAQLSGEQTAAVMKAANEISAEDVTRCLDVLKNSDLKYSLITDLITFAKTDNNYSEQEQQNVQQMAKYLGVDQQQYSLLDQFAEEAATSKATPDQMQSQSFLSSLGLQEKLQGAGINGNSLLKGLLGIAAPMILAKMMSGGLNRNRGGGMFGGGGGMFGSGGGMFGGSGGMSGGGGLGSLIGMLSGGRGMGSMGGVLGGLFGGRRG
jgi:uncharacterized tellurite resistance protein B-like protein